jgi:hypothetical protein
VGEVLFFYGFDYRLGLDDLAKKPVGFSEDVSFAGMSASSHVSVYVADADAAVGG